MGEGTSARAAAQGEDPPGTVHPLPATPAPAATEKRRMSELAQRLLTAAFLVPFILYIIYLGGIPYLATVMAIILLCQREFYGLIEGKGAHPAVGLGLAAGAAVALVAYVGSEYHATILMTASLLALMVAQLRKAEMSEALASISGTFFGVFYVGWLMSHAILLRRFYEAALDKYGAPDVLALELAPECGIFFVVYTATVVVWCDTGAYFAGRAYGRRKLAPRISPGKTIEGALGGVLLGTLAGLAMKAIFDFFWPDLSAGLIWSVAIPFGIVLSLVGILGDLVESLLKRDANVKDAGALLPGMGGVLDRFDAPLLAIPVMYYMLLAYVFVRIG